MKAKTLLAVSAMTLIAVTTSTNEAQARDDAYRMSGSKAQRHARAVFEGVFGQCRSQSPGEARGVVSLVFEVRPDGRFHAMSTFKGADGKDVLRTVSQCMGSRANKARKFPQLRGGKALIGVKYSVESSGSNLVLRKGATENLDWGSAMTWGRSEP